MLQVQLGASRAESLLISSFKIKGYGSGNEEADVDTVMLIADLNANGVYDEYVDTLLADSPDTFTADDGTITFSFSPAYVLPASESHTWLVTYDLHDSIPNNKDVSRQGSSWRTTSPLRARRRPRPSRRPSASRLRAER